MHYLGRILGRRLHPAIRKHSVISMDANAVRKMAESETPFEIQLGETRLEVRVRPEPALDTASEVIVVSEEGEESRKPISEVVTFAGSVIGADEESEVRLTITEHYLSGYVWHGDEWWFIEPLHKFVAGAEPGRYIVYRAKDLRFRVYAGEDEVPPPPIEADSGVQPPHRVNPTVGLLLVADRDYCNDAELTKRRVDEHHADLVNSLNGIFAKQTGIDFRGYSVAFESKRFFNTNDSVTLLGDLRSAVTSLGLDLGKASVRQTWKVEIAHLTTPKNLDNDSRLWGRAQTPGVFSVAEQKLITVGGAGWRWEALPSWYGMMIAAHEIGHNFNGMHDEADTWCVFWLFWCWHTAGTVMYPLITSYCKPRFSEGTEESSRDNLSRIQDNMRNGRNRNF
jgi:hypothetical protein